LPKRDSAFVIQITLHQGEIESIFHDSMAAVGVKVDRPIRPTSIELSKSESELQDPKAHPVRVSSPLIQLKTIVNVNIGCIEIFGLT
jgi:phenol 2-monooxygenase